MKNFCSILILLLFAAFPVFGQNPPDAPREFRAVWIATVANIDFPSRQNLTVVQQKKELLKILDRARELNFNCVVFQVRPQADALYNSKIEPWSEYLTGEMGKPTAARFDPLAFLTAEAHKRGILVHAWFNPFRALHPTAKTVAANHISKTRPDLVRKYGKYSWLDPTAPDAQKISLNAILDVVRRYDVDGVHFDDYFYPYPERGGGGKLIEFPDEQNWKKYKQNGGKLARGDWRRQRVDNFVQQVAREIKRAKPEVMFGISPFGIWQPVPEKNITGFNARAELYADARKWLQAGWVDYLAPQLYWETARQGQSFPVLLDWWQEQNTLKRHLWAGVAVYRVGSNQNFTPGEIENQIKITRSTAPETRGAIHFSAKHLLTNANGVAEILRDEVYASAALIPQSDWIKSSAPPAPVVRTVTRGGNVLVSWLEPRNATRKAFWFVVRAKDANGWSMSILPATQKSIALSANRQITEIKVTGVDRLGNESK